MPQSNNSSYLAKLLTLIVKKQQGRITVPMSDLVLDDAGSGIQVHIEGDGANRQLVITHVPAGASFYRIEENLTWLTPHQIPQQPQPPRPLTTEDLIAKAWSESAATPTVEEQRRMRVVNRTDETQAVVERKLAEDRALRELTGADYRTPSARTPSSVFRETVRLSSKP